MKKEVIFAIIIGFTLGLVITLGVWTANKALKQNYPFPKETQPEITPQTSLLPTPSIAEFFLDIVSPPNNIVWSEEKIEIQGKTIPEAIVTVVYPEGEKIAVADNEGNFNVEITLIGGSNDISVTAFNKEDEEINQTLTVVYSTAKI